MFETIYVQMPEIRNIILIKVPGMELSKRVYLNDEFAETMFKKKKSKPESYSEGVRNS